MFANSTRATTHIRTLIDKLFCDLSSHLRIRSIDDVITPTDQVNNLFHSNEFFLFFPHRLCS